MANFLSRAFSLWLTTAPQTTSFDRELRTVAQAIDQHYGTDLSKAQLGGSQFSPEAQVALTKFNLEELLAMADETMDIQLRQALEKVIFNTLEESIRNKQRLQDREYHKLLSNLVKSNKKACLISFNYDPILDHALTDLTRAKRGTWSYSITFNGGIDDNFPSYSGKDSSRIYLLKLHGSLNWRKCKTCNALRLYYFKNYNVRISLPSCRSCNATPSEVDPVLVAPTPVKTFPKALEEAWDKAAECLRQAQNLTAIGYSFPTFDRKARDLFLKSFIIPNLNAERRPRLTPVIKDECTRNAIKSWFLPAVDKAVDEYCSFEEYCAVLQKSVKR